MPAKGPAGRALARSRSSWTWREGARVAIRMYGGFLGDCFLLRFRASKRDAFMLIDCGMFLGSPGERERMRAVAEDIKTTTGGRLDVVVITHEHWDHISGFHHAADVFDAIVIDELWLAWTEDPKDDSASELRNRRSAALRVLQAAAPRMAATGAAPAACAAVETALGFAGLGAAARVTTRDILDAMKARAKKVHYLSPGRAPLGLAGIEATRVHVLGPPRDPALLLRSDPSRRGREVYELAGAADGDRAVLDAGLHAEILRASGFPPEKDPKAESAMPFGRKHWRPIDALAKPAKGAPNWIAALAASYGDPAESWRRVDGDWLGVAESLALKLDGDTNNTSLALAIELSPGDDTLLFPGDAQVGNWLSWAAYRYPPNGDPTDPATTTRDRLLAQTVIYKVGHHGSHNATLRAEGLEKMTSPNLVALMPIDEDYARGKKHWNMPFPALSRRLDEMTGANVLRADRSAAEMLDRKIKSPLSRQNFIFDHSTENINSNRYIEIFL